MKYDSSTYAGLLIPCISALTGSYYYNKKEMVVLFAAILLYLGYKSYDVIGPVGVAITAGGSLMSVAFVYHLV